MNKLNNDKGITLVVLVVTIILMLMIAGVTISTGLLSADNAKTNSKITEVNMVAHAILERYTKVSITKEEYPGTKTTASDLAIMESELSNKGLVKKGNTDDYYTITPENGLKNLGITKATDTYIVNYKTGEAFNLSIKKTQDNEILYISNT